METAPSFTLALLSNPQVHPKCLTTALVHADLGFSLKKKQKKRYTSAILKSQIKPEIMKQTVLHHKLLKKTRGVLGMPACLAGGLF